MAIMDMIPVWDSLTLRARAGRLNEAHLQRALTDDHLHHRLARTETLRLPPTLEWVFRFPEEFAVINMAHGAYLKRQCTMGRYQAVVRERLVRSSMLVSLFAQDDRLPLLAWLLSQGTATRNWPSVMDQAGFSCEVIAALVKQRVLDHASAKAFLQEDGAWRWFSGIAFTQIITLTATFAPEIALQQRGLIERHMIEFDPETCTYRTPLPEARSILRAILLRELDQLFDKIESNLNQRAS